LGQIFDICPTFASCDLELEGSLRLVRPEKSFFSDFSDVWYVDRGQWLMHDLPMWSSV